MDLTVGPATMEPGDASFPSTMAPLKCRMAMESSLTLAFSLGPAIALLITSKIDISRLGFAFGLVHSISFPIAS